VVVSRRLTPPCCSIPSVPSAWAHPSPLRDPIPSVPSDLGALGGAGLQRGQEAGLIKRSCIKLIHQHPATPLPSLSPESHHSRTTALPHNPVFSVPSDLGALGGAGLQRGQEVGLFNELQDEEGYFQHRVGERLAERYVVSGRAGGYLFSWGG
jgi:hypothetical protein